MEQLLILKEPTGIISDSKELFKKIKRIKIDYMQENFIVFYLDVRHKVIKTKLVATGIIDACMISPAIIFREGILRNAKKIIIAHNHPSGDLRPSREDIDVYRRIEGAGDLIQIEVLDSIVFNKKQFYSMKGEQ